jgi:hypothetical protein
MKNDMFLIPLQPKPFIKMSVILIEIASEHRDPHNMNPEVKYVVSTKPEL